MFRYVLYLIAFVFLLWTAATSLTQVQSHERAVIRRFGRILDHKPEQGLHIGWPWGIDRVELAPVGRVRTITVGLIDKDDKEEETIPPGQMLTGDHNLVNVQASINFKVREEDMEQYVLQKDQVDAFVARAAESLLAEWIAARRVDDVLRQGKSQLPRFLHERLQERLKSYDLGIEIEHASIPKLVPPDQVKDAFDRVGQAESTKDTRITEAKQRADQRKSEANSEKYKLEQRAQAYARDEPKKALAEADGFVRRLAQYREFSAKDLDYLNALWLNDVTQLFAKMRDGGRIELLDNYLTGGELNITQFPLQPRKK